MLYIETDIFHQVTKMFYKMHVLSWYSVRSFRNISKMSFSVSLIHSQYILLVTSPGCIVSDKKRKTDIRVYFYYFLEYNVANGMDSEIILGIMKFTN